MRHLRRAVHREAAPDQAVRSRMPCRVLCGRAVAGGSLCGILATAVFATGCTERGGGHDARQGAKPVARAASLEQIATTTGCEPRVQTDADELKQASCETSQGRFVVVTYPTENAQRSWLKAAQEWGGSYLVGERWVIVGGQDLLRSFQAQLGGEIETVAHGGGHDGHGGRSDQGEHGGH